MSEVKVDVNLLGLGKKEKVKPDPSEPSDHPDHQSEGSDGSPGDNNPGGDGPNGGGDGPGDGDDNGGGDDHPLLPDPDQPSGEVELVGTVEEQIRRLTEVFNLQNRAQDKYNNKLEKFDKMVADLKELNEFKDKADKVRKRKDNYGEVSVIPIPKFEGEYNENEVKNRFKIKDYWHVIPIFDVKKSDTYKIGTFLKSCNRAQAECKMNETQFLHQMRWRLAGPIVDQFDHWITNDHGVQRIYFDLYTCYNVEVEPKDAQSILATYKVSKTINFGGTCEEIDKLALLGSQNIEDKKCRTTVYNNLYKNTLLTRMPDTISSIIRDVITDYKLYHDEEPKADQIVRSLNRFADKINENFHASKTYNYVNRKANVILDKAFHKPGANKADAKTTVNETKAEKGPKPLNRGFKGQKKVNVVDIKQPTFRKFNESPLQRPSSSGGFSINAVHTICGRAHPHLEVACILRLEESRIKNGHSGARGRKYCVFCASYTHTGAEGCNSLYTDSFARAQATPTQQSCTTCAAKLNKDLHHPARLCPLRNTMLDAYKRGTIAPQGIFKYFLSKNTPNRA
jgi:hypothetical protein